MPDMAQSGAPQFELRFASEAGWGGQESLQKKGLWWAGKFAAWQGAGCSPRY